MSEGEHPESLPVSEPTSPPVFPPTTSHTDRTTIFAPLYRALQNITARVSGLGISLRRGCSASTKWALMRLVQGVEHLFLRSHRVRGSTRLAVKASARGAGSVDKDASKTAAGASRNLEEIAGIVDEALVNGMSEGLYYLKPYTLI
jgi:hypothetical protein